MSRDLITLSQYDKTWNSNKSDRSAARLRISVGGRLFTVFATEQTTDARIEDKADARALNALDLTTEDLEAVARQMYDDMKPVHNRTYNQYLPDEPPEHLEAGQ